MITIDDLYKAMWSGVLFPAWVAWVLIILAVAIGILSRRAKSRGGRWL